MGQPLFQIPFIIRGEYFSKNQQVSAPSMDFSKLPWFDDIRKTDVNFNHPFTSKNSVRKPFETPTTILEKGIHLHFIIPHYLGKQISDYIIINCIRIDHEVGNCNN